MTDDIASATDNISGASDENTIISEIPLRAPSKQWLQRNTAWALIAFLIFIVIGLLALPTGAAAFFHPVDFMTSLAIVSAVVLAGMCLLYSYASSFYDDRFYAFVGIGWIGNAIYIFFEGFFKSSEPRWEIFVYVFGQLYLVPFFAASVAGDLDRPGYRRLAVTLGAWWAFITGGLLLNNYLPRFSWDTAGVSGLAGVPGVLYATWTLVRTGQALTTRLRRDVHGVWFDLFPSTFYVYAALQPLYLVRQLPAFERFSLAVFLIALGLKAFNSIALFRVMLLDFWTLKARIETMEMWQDLGILTAAVEHDIKNPLQVIANHLRMMERKHQANDDILKRIGSIRKEMRRIFATTGIIQTLRGGRNYYARLMQKTNIHELMQRSIKSVKSELNTEGILFKTDDNIVFTNAYPPQLQQVFVNVLRNAVEAIREQNPNSGLISVHYDVLPEYRLAVRFRDNGCGIPQSAIPELGKFYSTKRTQKANSGIGLYVSKRILGFHNGTFEWQSEVHKGTEVTIVLPRWRDERR